jgi:peptide/nickel transport system substrate-binding protein
MRDQTSDAVRHAITRRDLIRLSLVGATGLAVSPLVAACTQQPTPSTQARTARPAKTTITIAQSFQVRGFDPHVRNADEEHALHTAIFDKLIGRDPKTLAAVPALATSWRALDPTTWEFKLRNDVKFHNGEAFNADVVKFNFDRIKVTAVGSFHRTTLGAIVKTVEVVDPTTVRLITTDPDAVLLERLQIFWIVPPKYVQEKGNEGVDATPVGTGPFKFMQWDKGNRVTLERNNEYFGAKPTVSTAVFRTILEPATAIAELLTEGVDVIDGVPPDQVARIENSGVARLVQHESARVLWIRIDALGRGGSTPLTDARVRRAAVVATDRASILKNLQGGYGKVVATPVVSALFGYDPSLTPEPFDPSLARSLLQQAGYRGQELKFALYPVSGFRDHKLLIETIASNLNDVGMKTSILSIDAAQLAPLRTSGKLGDFSPGILGGRVYDAVGNLDNFRKTNPSAYYSSDQLESALIQAETNLDESRRKTLLSQAQTIWKTDVGGMTVFGLPHMLGVNKSFDIELTADWPRVPLSQVRPAP